MQEKLIFGKGNAKLDKRIWTFSLPAGWACSGASACLAKVTKEGVLSDGPKPGESGFRSFGSTGHKTKLSIVDGKPISYLENGPGKRLLKQVGQLIGESRNRHEDKKFRCFAASAEALYPNVRVARWHNFELLKGKKTETMVELILASLPKNAEIIRIHVSGDFFNQNYFDAWCEVARVRPEMLFYAYTKSVNLWVERLGRIPANLRLTASYGGKWDHLIAEHDLKSAVVVFSSEQATALGLSIDHDDSHAYGEGGSFALLLHGVQPAGTLAAKALSALKAQGHTGYGKNATRALVALERRKI